MKLKRWTILFLILALLLGGCAAKSYDGRGEAMDMEAQKNEAATYAPGDGYLAENGGKTETVLPENRKLIRTIHMEAETRDMDTLLEGLNAQVTALAGYVENRNIYNGSSYYGSTLRHADLTIRIPVDKADAFVARVESDSNVISSNEDLDDVTMSYVATESRMKALQTEEARLLELMEKASYVSELLEIEARLSQVRSELEIIVSQLRVYDNQIDYATIYLSVSEVQELTVMEERTLWQRISDGFMESLEGVGSFFVELFVFVIAASPVLVVLAVVGLGIFFLVRRLFRRRKPKNPPPPTHQPPTYPPAPE